MRCIGADDLARFLHGQLSAADVELLQAHLDECAECFKQLTLGAAAMSESFGISNPWLSSRLSAVPGLMATPPDSDSPTVPAGTAFGAYVVEGVLGRGGMGVVYRARDTRSGAPVALKTVRTAIPAALEALRREILFLAEARHPGLVAILGHEVTRGDPWYAMELLEGETLNDRNRVWWGARLKVAGDRDERRTVLPDAGQGHLPEILSLFRRLCEPLDFVHHAGIVHCDLKPANVFLRNGSVPILMDFGLAIQARGAVGRESLSLASRGRGTLPYMCPEVIQGKIPDARADLYALGCMLYESVVGQPPFVALNRDELVNLHLHANVVPASARVTGVPKALDELLQALLVKDPQDRLGEAARVAAVLEGLGVASNDSQVRPRAYLYRPQLVGRDAERQSANELAEEALRGHGSFMMLSGESGIGKTFLVSELCQRAMLRGMRVVTGDCEAPPTALPSSMHAPRALYPLSSFFNLLRDECRRAGGGGVERLLGDLRVLAAYSPTLAMLPEVLEAGAPAGLPDKSARERVLEALRNALSELAREQPLLIAIDDLQWADELSIAFLESLSPELLEGIPVLLIGTYRSDESNPTLERLLSRHGIISVALTRLGRPSLSAMVGHMLGKGSPPPALVDFVGKESEGVPFFVAEYLRSALAESALVLDRGEWTFDRAPALGGDAPVLGFPERLKELVRRRLHGLSASALRCLEAAAVLGRELEPMVLAHALGCDIGHVREQVVEAMQRGMLEHAGDGFRFAHDKFREVAYDSLSSERKVELHAAVATTLEHLFSEDSAELERRAGALARHFERGGKPERAIEYLHKAGLRALQLSANAEAIGLLRGAVDLDSRLVVPAPALRRAIWERGIAEALAGLGRFSDGEQHLYRAAALLGHPIANNNAGAILQVSRELARRVVRRFLPASAHALDETRLEAGRVYERVHRSAYFTGKAAHIFVGTLTSLNLWETIRPGPELVTAYANTAQLCGVLPVHGWTRLYLEKANRVLAVAPDPTAETLVRLSEGVYFAGVGERAKATIQIEHGITIAEGIGYHRRHEECLAVRGSIDIVAGHWSRAAQWTAPLEASARARGDKQMLAWGLNQKLECCLLRNDASSAEPLLAGLQELLPFLNDPDRFWALGLSAYARLLQERWEEAGVLATAASELLPKIPPVFGYCIGAYDRLTETWLRLINRGQLQGAADARAIRAWTQAERALSRSAKTFPVARPLALLQEGTVQMRRGRRARAVAAWRRGLELAASMQLTYQEARLSQALAKALDSPADCATLSKRARAALEALELPPDSDTSGAILTSPTRAQLAM